MDKKSKIFLWVFFLLILASVGATYYRIVIRRNYLIESQIECDPTTEKCFVYHCDSATETCIGNEEEDTSYYKIVKRKANKIPDCDPAKDENCQPFVCGQGEKNCGETFCNEQTKQTGDECNDPEQYVVDNPQVLEEETDCDSNEDPTCQEEEDAPADELSTDSDQAETQPDAAAETEILP